MANYWCKAVRFESSVDGIPDYNFGLFSAPRTTTVSVDVDAATVYIGQQCFTYSDDIELDASWKSARAFAIISIILGTFITIILWFVPCMPDMFGGSVWKGFTGATLVLMPLVQGLTMLLLTSDVCTDNPVLNVLKLSAFYNDDCSMSEGTYMSIVSTVSWFITGAMMAVYGAPEDEEAGRSEAEPKPEE